MGGSRIVDPEAPRKARRSLSASFPLSLTLHAAALGLLAALSYATIDGLSDPDLQITFHVYAPPPTPAPMMQRGVEHPRPQRTAPEPIHARFVQPKPDTTPSAPPAPVPSAAAEPSAPVESDEPGEDGPPGFPGGDPFGDPNGSRNGIPGVGIPGAPSDPVPAPGEGPLEIVVGMDPPRLVHKVAPDYPEFARRAHVTGTVELRAVIDENGDVTAVEVVSGHPLLSPAAADAVRLWRYHPATLRGRAVRVYFRVRVTFTLD